MKIVIDFPCWTCNHLLMFIRQTKTSSSKTDEPYTTFRLVTTERIGGKVRQKTLLNLGRNFSLEQELWPQVCSRIEEILYRQQSLVTVSEAVEALAQRYAALLLTRSAEPQEVESTDYREVDISSLELVRPRSVGVEHVAMSALNSLCLPEILSALGFNGGQQAAAIGSVVARMAEPGSELAGRAQRLGRVAGRGLRSHAPDAVVPEFGSVGAASGRH